MKVRKCIMTSAPRSGEGWCVFRRLVGRNDRHFVGCLPLKPACNAFGLLGGDKNCSGLLSLFPGKNYRKARHPKCDGCDCPIVSG